MKKHLRKRMELDLMDENYVRFRFNNKENKINRKSPWIETDDIYLNYTRYYAQDRKYKLIR